MSVRYYILEALNTLYVDSHILSKIKALMLKIVISNIIYQDQTGFITDRYNFSNIVALENLIDCVNKNHITSLLTCVDFEKAFDSIEWSFLLKS